MRLREFTHDDLQILEGWLAQDFIQKFWGEPLIWLTEINENISAQWIKYFIVESDVPIGFLQYYETEKAPQGAWSAEPIGTVGIDYLIGNIAYLGKGNGSSIVGLLVDFIKAKNEFDYIIADPVIENASSVKVLEKNGFLQNTNGLFCLDLVNTGIRIYKATKNDVNEITLLFRDTIRNVNNKDYTEEEIEDWSSWWNDHDKWLKRIAEQFFIKAMIENKIVGFCSLAFDGYLDLLFTHKDYQGRGVASSLMRRVESKARQQGIDLIYSDVSITAKNFFEKHGYSIVKQQYKKSRNKELINFKMLKLIES